MIAEGLRLAFASDSLRSRGFVLLNRAALHVPRAAPQDTLRFQIGDTVQHAALGFRAVVYNFDTKYSQGRVWLEQFGKDLKHGEKQPFYHVLYDMSWSLKPDVHFGYLAEELLERTNVSTPDFSNPLLERLFFGYDAVNRRFVPRDHLLARSKDKLGGASAKVQTGGPQSA